MNSRESSGSADTVRAKGLRIFADNMLSAIKGWRFPDVSRKKYLRDDEKNSLHLLSDVSTRIRWRDGLKEVNHNRIANMRLCCSTLDGYRLNRGEVFSLMRVIGDPNERAGFLKGPAIIRGQLRQTYGGGLCQVSTTLFNAALLAGLDILQKYNHSVDIWGEERFIELGRDAVYVYALRDLKFRNGHPDDVVIKIGVNEQNLSLDCQVLSKTPRAEPVTVESKIIKTIMPEIKGGDMAHARVIKGWVVLTVRRQGLGENARVTYRKMETYKPQIVRSSPPC